MKTDRFPPHKEVVSNQNLTQRVMEKESEEARALREKLEDQAVSQIKRTIPSHDVGGRMVMAAVMQDSINHTVEEQYPPKKEK